MGKKGQTKTTRDLRTPKKNKGKQGKKKKDVPNQGQGHEKQLQARQSNRNHLERSYVIIRKVRESKKSEATEKEG